jgi:hypothetical protein
VRADIDRRARDRPGTFEQADRRLARALQQRRDDVRETIRAPPERDLYARLRRKGPLVGVESNKPKEKIANRLVEELKDQPREARRTRAVVRVADDAPRPELDPVAAALQRRPGVRQIANRDVAVLAGKAPLAAADVALDL